MKYIKKFEMKSFDTNKCEVGDYIKYRQTNYSFNAKIIKKDDSIFLVQNYSGVVTIVKEQILRFLTDEEIEKIEMDIIAKKFNL